MTLRECEEHLAVLRPQREAQQQQIEDLQQQLTKADATLARLRSQQDILKSRLVTAQSKCQSEAVPPSPAWNRKVLAVGAAACAVGAACLLLMMILHPTRPTQVEPIEAAPHETPVPGLVDLAGRWQLTLPEGGQHSVLILNLGQNRYLLRSGGNTSGMYELRGDRLAVVDPDDKRLTEFVWSVQDSNKMVLVESPAVAKVGSDYRGAVLNRIISPAAPSFVTEGAGWGGFRIGATLDELIDHFGPPEVNPDPDNQWKRWLSQYHIDCLVDNVRGVYELRFNKGFTRPLASGVRVGSPESEVVSAYGTPDRLVTKSQSKMLQYSGRGVLMWIVNGVVYDFTVFSPTPPKTTGTDFAYDALLNDEQRSFRDSIENRFASYLKQGWLRDLDQQEKARKEEELLPQLSSNASNTRIYAINVLAALRSKRALPDMLHIATERVQKNNRDRWMAVRALGFLGDTAQCPISFILRITTAVIRGCGHKYR